MRQIHQLIMSSTKMNSKTHKIISATYYPVERHFVVPIDWEIEDIHIRYDHVFHKEEFKEVPVYEMEGDEKYPEKIEEGDWEYCAGYFSCCESEEEDSLQCDICNNYVSNLKNGLCNKCEEEQEEENERFCDNEVCPYEGFCCYEVKKEFEGKPWICVGCATGKGLQEQEQELMSKEDK